MESSENKSSEKNKPFHYILNEKGHSLTLKNHDEDIEYRTKPGLQRQRHRTKKIGKIFTLPKSTRTSIKKSNPPLKVTT